MESPGFASPPKVSQDLMLIFLALNLAYKAPYGIFLLDSQTIKIRVFIRSVLSLLVTDWGQMDFPMSVV